MDKEISLARKEEERRSVLLPGSGAGEDGKGAVCRDEREEASRNAKGHKGGKIGSAKKKGKGNAKVKGRGRGRKAKSGPTYSFGGAIRKFENRNPPARRSAKELGITWLDSYCEDSPTKGHLLKGTTRIDGGTVYKCSICHRVKWMPDNLDECIKLGNSMKIYGQDEGYQRILDKHPAARRLMAKIQDIYYLRKALTPEQFPIAVAAVIMNKEYPFDVEIQEEEVL